MKATRKIEYAEKRVKKATEHEISQIKLAEHKERIREHKPIYVKVDARTWKEVKQ